MDFFFLLQQHGTKKREARALACTIPRVFFVEDYSSFIMRSFQPPLLSGFGFGRAT